MVIESLIKFEIKMCEKVDFFRVWWKFFFCCRFYLLKLNIIFILGIYVDGLGVYLFSGVVE